MKPLKYKTLVALTALIALASCCAPRIADKTYEKHQKETAVRAEQERMIRESLATSSGRTAREMRTVEPVAMAPSPPMVMSSPPAPAATSAPDQLRLSRPQLAGAAPPSAGRRAPASVAYDGPSRSERYERVEVTGSRYIPIVASALLISGTKVDTSYPLVGMLILPHKPLTLEQREDYRLICSSFIGSYSDIKDFENVPKADVAPMYWMVKKNALACDTMVAEYDYPRAQIFLSRMSYIPRGPMLIAWPTKNPKDIIVLELNDFTKEDRGRAFILWQKMIARNGATLAVYKEQFRNFLQRYGDTILKAVTAKA